MGSPWEPPGPIQVENAVIEGGVNIAGQDVRPECCFSACRFLGSLSARGTTFRKTVLFDKCRFADATFAGATFRGSFYAPNTRFAGQTFFTRAAFHSLALLDGAEFLDPNATVNFNECSFDSTLALRHALVCGSLDLVRARISGQLNMEESRFTGKDATIDLTRVEVGDCLFLGEAVFSGSLLLDGSNIGGHLVLSNARLRGPRPTALADCEVGGDVILSGASFSGPCNLQCIRVEGALLAVKSNFTSAGESLNMNGSQVAGQVNIEGSVFAGSAHFCGAHFRQQLRAVDANFAGADGEVTFDLATVAEGVFFNRACFSGPARLGMSAGRFFDARSAAFRNKDHGPSLSGLVVTGPVDLTKATFQGAAYFADVEVSDSLTLRAARFLDPCAPAIFQGGRVGGDLDLTNASFAGPVLAANVGVEGDLLANDTTFGNATEGPTSDDRGLRARSPSWVPPGLARCCSAPRGSEDSWPAEPVSMGIGPVSLFPLPQS